jgi:rod shape-determining protein MreC
MRLTAPVKAAAQRLALPVLILASMMLIMLGKADVLLFDRVRIALGDFAAPILNLVAQPIATVASGVQKVENMADIYRQNAALREENTRLLHWEQVARRLEADNANLRNLVKLVPEGAVSFVAARVIADSGGAFVRNVLVNAGLRDGVQRGQAAMTGDGLIGRIAEVGERTSRILLLTDLNSHVPVMLEGTHERAVLEGDNSDEPRLIYLQPKTVARIGERIVTSGSGGVFPPGLPVGMIASVAGGTVRVEPFAELGRLEIVRIVNYGLDGILPQSAVPPQRVSRLSRSAHVSAAR